MRVSIFVYITLVGICIAQQPAPIKCPKGAMNCFKDGNVLGISYCYKSIKYILQNGDSSCETSADLSKTNSMVFVKTGSLDWKIEACEPYYTLVTINLPSGKYKFCTSTPIRAAIESFSDITGTNINSIVTVCENGYPSQSFDKCILRNSLEYYQQDYKLSQGPDPIGMNCIYGSRFGEEVFCAMCKPGYIIQVVGTQRSNNKCIQQTTEPQGCMRVRDGRCEYCNYYAGYLPSDD